MLLISALILGVASAMVELLLYFQVQPLRSLIEKYEICGLILSMLLSMLIGHAFGAVGVTVLIAGVVSTVMTQPIYFGINRIKKWQATRRIVIINEGDPIPAPA